MSDACPAPNLSVRAIKGRFEQMREAPPKGSPPGRRRPCDEAASPRPRSCSVGAAIRAPEAPAKGPAHPQPCLPHFPPSAHFSSFAEKQRLVESVVASVRTAAALEKRRRQKEEAVTRRGASKFEKNLKNVLVRRRWRVSREEKELLALEGDPESHSGLGVEVGPLGAGERSEDAPTPTPTEEEGEPVRPPRRRRPKKGMAPQPPSPAAQNAKVDYEEDLERSLEGDRDRGGRPLDETFSDASPKTSQDEAEDEQLLRSCRGMSASEPSLGPRPLPAGVPPKKPPRTFAYDVYRSLKPEGGADGAPLASSSSAELESLYTKPLKRLKERERPASPPNAAHAPAPAKPAIAPKPVDIAARARARQRLSVAEPPPVKRNSSFRFSFRRRKKGSASPPRPATLHLESQVGRRLRAVTRNLQSKKLDPEKRVRFQSGGGRKETQDVSFFLSADQQRGPDPFKARTSCRKQSQSN